VTLSREAGLFCREDGRSEGISYCMRKVGQTNNWSVVRFCEQYSGQLGGEVLRRCAWVMSV